MLVERARRRRKGRPLDTKLSVNLNKVALLRNSRGTGYPDILEAARLVIAAGCDGLTIHPRSDARHATLEDLHRLAALDEVVRGDVELNIEGDLRPDLMNLVREVRPTQFTMVPVKPGEVTTTHGWHSRDDEAALREAIAFFDGRVRISLFVDPAGAGIRLAADVGAQAVELHTYDYAVAFPTAEREAVTDRYVRAAREARSLGLRVHAGHDLNVENLGYLVDCIHPDEVSIGHALTTHALLSALPGVTAQYLRVLREPAGSR